MSRSSRLLVVQTGRHCWTASLDGIAGVQPKAAAEVLQLQLTNIEVEARFMILAICKQLHVFIFVPSLFISGFSYL